MIKVAFYIESMILGGAEKVLVDIVNHMDTDVFDMTIVSLFKESVYPTASTYDLRALVNDKVKICSLVDNRNKLKYQFFNRAYAHTDKGLVYKTLVRDDYDIEVAFYEGLPTEFVSHSTNKKSRKIAWLHTNNDRLYQDKTAEYIAKAQHMYSRFDCVVGVSEFVTQSFQKYIKGIPCRTIHNGIDISKIREKASEDCGLTRSDMFTFITVGRLVPVKGYDRLIRVADRLNKEGYQFLILMIGDGGERDQLSSMIDAFSLNDRVKLLGVQDNPYKYFSICDAFICTSYSEGFSLALLEAMSCRLPVLSTRFDGADENLGIINRNLIFDNDENGIYSMLKAVIENPRMLSDYSERCRLQAEAFDISKQSALIQQLFTEETKHE